MAYLSEITVSSVIKREKFETIEEIRNYFERKYPDLLLDEKLLQSYFPTCVTPPKKGFTQTKVNTRKRTLLILSEYFKHNFTYQELTRYLSVKYPDIFFTICIVKKTLNPNQYSPGIASQIKAKQVLVKKKVNAHYGEKLRVTSDFPFYYLLKDEVETLTYYDLKRVQSAHLYLNDYSYEQISTALDLDQKSVKRYFRDLNNFFMCKDEYVRKIVEKQEEMKIFSGHIK